jgi:hypothetical protein
MAHLLEFKIWFGSINKRSSVLYNARSTTAVLMENISSFIHDKTKNSQSLSVLRQKCSLWLEQIGNGRATPEDFIIWFRERIPWLIDEVEFLRKQRDDYSKLARSIDKQTILLESLYTLLARRQPDRSNSAYEATDGVLDLGEQIARHLHLKRPRMEDAGSESDAEIEGQRAKRKRPDWDLHGR